MAITKEALGRRIRMAREACGMTQQEVAERIGVSRSALGQIEAGNRAVSSLELDQLAHQFGRDIRAFLAEDFLEEDPLAVLFRSDGEASAVQAEVRARLRGYVALARERTNLERLLGVDRHIGPPAIALPTPRSPWEAAEQGRTVAEAERRRLSLGLGPLPDIGALLESQGVRTALLALPDDVSGLTLSNRELGTFVVVNSGHPYVRRRFSFAHEYAHVVADRERSGLISRRAMHQDLIETRANVFAANFLMPEPSVRWFVAALGKGRPSRLSAAVFDGEEAFRVEARSSPGSQQLQVYDVIRLAQYFRVSRPAALYRLKTLRLIKQRELEKLLEAADKAKDMMRLLGLRELEDREAQGVFQRRVMVLALEAYRREEVSRGKLREVAAMCQVVGKDFEQLVDDAGLS